MRMASDTLPVHQSLRKTHCKRPADIKQHNECGTGSIGMRTEAVLMAYAPTVLQAEPCGTHWTAAHPDEDGSPCGFLCQTDRLDQLLHPDHNHQNSSTSLCFQAWALEAKMLGST
jgi:hypothetical protein